jgi:hypothetical protein
MSRAVPLISIPLSHVMVWPLPLPSMHCIITCNTSYNCIILKLTINLSIMTATNLTYTYGINLTTPFFELIVGSCHSPWIFSGNYINHLIWHEGTPHFAHSVHLWALYVPLNCINWFNFIMDTVFSVRYKISVYILFTLISVCQWFSSVQLPTIFATNAHYQPTTVFTAVWIQTHSITRMWRCVARWTVAGSLNALPTHPVTQSHIPDGSTAHNSLKSCSMIPYISKLNHLSKCHTATPGCRSHSGQLSYQHIYNPNYYH